MKAAVMDEIRKPLMVREVPDPEVFPGGAVVRVEANGICRSDWHAWVGDWSWFGLKLNFPHVLGHEFCGVVEEVGEGVTRVHRGQRVLVPFSQGEGHCDFCRGGQPHLCDMRVTPGIAYWGGFGRLVGVPFADVNLVPLPDAIGFTDAASMGCRYMTSFHALVDRAQVRAGEWVAVHGCGGIGLAAVQIATALGASVIGVDIGDDKLALARSLGAVATVNAKTDNAVKAIGDLTGGGAHVSVDALGVAATCQASVMSLRRQGRHLQIGLTSSAEKGMVPIPIDLLVLKEASMIGSYGMPAPRFDAMLQMVQSGKLAPGKLVSRTVPLEEAGGVLASMDSFATVGVTVIDRYYGAGPAGSQETRGIEITVNGKRHPVAAAPDTPLLYVLRNELGLRGPRFGCGISQCGACTVHVDGRAVRSCGVPVSAVGAAAVTTLEGLGTPARPHPLQRAFIDAQAAQCGFCINGMIMTAAALLAANPKPDDRELRGALAGNLCRCGTHLRILRAIKQAAGVTP